MYATRPASSWKPDWIALAGNKNNRWLRKFGDITQHIEFFKSGLDVRLTTPDFCFLPWRFAKLTMV